MDSISHNRSDHTLASRTPCVGVEPLENRVLLSAVSAASPDSLRISEGVAASVAAEADAYETNNRIETAFDLGVTRGSLDGHSGLASANDDDWYHVTVGPGDFVAELQASAAQGDLNVEVYTADRVLLGGHYAVTDTAAVTLDLDRTTDLRILVYARLGDYQGNRYELTWSGAALGFFGPQTPGPPTTPTGPQAPDTSPVAGVADRYEENDVLPAATPLTGARGSVFATATDNDFYVIDAAAGRLTLTLTAEVVKGDLNIEVYDANGVLLRGGYEVRPVTELNLDLAADGPVHVFVYARHGHYQGNLYELAWSGANPTPTAPQPVPPVPPAGPKTPTGSPGAGVADRYEENDVLPAATPLDGARGSVFATATDNDFYVIDAAAGRLTLTLTAEVVEGDLNIEVYDANGVFLRGGYEVRPVTELNLDLAADGPVHVFVYARHDHYRGNLYELAWSGASAKPNAPAPPTVPSKPTAPPRPKPTDPTGGDTTPGNPDFPALQPVVSAGLSAWAGAARTGRADVLVLGDSLILHHGSGLDAGLNAGFDRTLGLAGSGLLSGNFTSSNGAGHGYAAFGQNPSNWRFDFLPGTDVDALSNDELAVGADLFARTQHPWGQITVNPGRGNAAELGVELGAPGDTAEPRRAFTFQAYVSGNGARFDVTRTAADGSVNRLGLRTVTGHGDRLVSIDLPAGATAGDALRRVAITDPSPLTFVPHGSPRTLGEAPLTVSNFRLIETGSTGATVTSWGYGGQSAREFYEEQYRPLGQANRARILDRVVEGGSGKLLVFVMEGLNDRNETQPSLTRGVVDGDSPEAFTDNVDTLIRGVRSDWARAGNHARDLHFVTFGTYDQGSDPKLEGYSAALRRHAQQTPDVSFIDLRTLSGGLTVAQMVDRGYLQGGASGDFIHLTEAGSVYYGQAIASLIGGTA